MEPTRPPRRRRSVIDRRWIEQHFGDIWPTHNDGFVDLIIECRRLFDGDLDQMLILSVVGGRTMRRGRVPALSYGDFLSGQRPHRASRTINALSIAEVTGIPRETVRRKIGALKARGWLMLDTTGQLRVTEQAARDVAPATQLTFDYLLAMFHLFTQLQHTQPEVPD